jgi:protein-arginine deiminase
MRADIAEAIGAENVTEYPVGQYMWDVWVQDEFEFTHQQTVDRSMHMVLDSIRNRGLDNLAENEMLGPDFGWLERGDKIMGNSLDAFGNLDCSPPLLQADTEYPVGRIYYGGSPTSLPPYQVDEGLRTFLDDQVVQAPLEIDSTWLAVGHVDEFMTFVPDPSASQGFRVLWADYRSAVDILESLDPNMALTRFADHGYDTVGEILADGLVEYNEDLTVEHLDPLKEQLKQEFGLTDDDFLPVPGLYESVHSNYALAMIPGMVNLAVWDNTLLIANPFFREYNTGADEEDANGNWLLDDGEDLNGDGLLNTYNDPFVQFMVDTMPSNLELVFLDNWVDYHLMWGEVHCGTNIVRTPWSEPLWWEVE